MFHCTQKKNNGKNSDISFEKKPMPCKEEKTLSSKEGGGDGLGMTLSTGLILINSIRDANMCQVTVSYSIRPLGAGG